MYEERYSQILRIHALVIKMYTPIES